MTRRAGVALFLLLCARGAFAQDFLEDIDQKLRFSNQDGTIVTDLSLMADVTAFAQDKPAQGLLFSDNDAFVAPRSTAFLDAGIGERILVHVHVDADRGVDPGEQSSGDVRFDAYFVEARLTDPGRVTVRVGKFATSFGGWVSRHLAWDNPMITAPLIYEDVLPMSDHSGPADAAAFAYRRDVVDRQHDWVPIVWGPSYTTGASVAASTDTLDVTLEAKNAAVSSRPQTWDMVSGGFETDPSVTGHLKWHPAEEWWFGSSFSRGPYLQDDAKPTLPPGKRIGDYDQTTSGI